MVKQNDLTLYRRILGWSYLLLRKFPQSGYTIIFAHMPKAAGISLNTVMKNHYGNGQILEVDPVKPRKAYLGVINLSLLTSLRLQAISGHAIWGIHEWLPKPSVYITMLRDPIERVISFYSYVLGSTEHHLHNEIVDRKMNLEEFLEWDKSAFEVSNLQSKLLSSSHPFQATHMSTVFEKAKNHLENHFLVGVTEQFEKSLKLFSTTFGWHNPQTVRENITPNRLNRQDIPSRTIRKIESLNEYDLKLYEIGNRLFAEQSNDPHSIISQKIIR